MALQHRPGVSGTGRGDEPVLVVDTRFGEHRAPNDAPLQAILHLEADLSDDDWPEGLIARYAGRWRPWSMLVEGREQVFWGLETGDRWAAFARVGVVRVVLTATGWDRAGVRLAVVAPEDYAASTTSR